MGEISGEIGAKYRSKQPTPHHPQVRGYNVENTEQYDISANGGLTE
jgi:hypothetical protein